MMTGFFVILSLCLCKKNWLEEKSDISLTVPSTIKDLQALLDNSNSVFNCTGIAIGEVSTDNVYMTPAIWQSQKSVERNAYIWASNIYSEDQVWLEWRSAYTRVYYANTVLESAEKIMPDITNTDALNNIKGSALFYRAFAHYEVVSIYAAPYNAASAATDLGIPLRLTSDFNTLSVRSSLQETYDRIIQDLQDAKDFLPASALYKNRPSRPAVFSLLARIYLSMEDYDNAKLFADSAMSYNNVLLNYNDLNASSSAPIPLPESNPEVIYFNTVNSIGSLWDAYVDTTLYSSYVTNDCRKNIFFSSSYPAITFKGNYNSLVGVTLFFNGLSTDELYLIQAECLARKGQYVQAMNKLNTLLSNRWITGTFVEFTAADATDALRQILAERRKELLYRSLRWTDLRRLNRDDRFKVTLTRKINSDTYTLPPNDLRYVFLIPPDVLLYSGMQQNPR